FCLRPGRAPDGAVIAVAGQLHIGQDAGARFIAAEHLGALQRLADDLSALERVELAPLDAMAARVLLIHRWRRIVLRYPALPDCLMPATCTGLNGRVAAAYNLLLPASELWLKTALDNGHTDGAILQRRFTPG
ncbi:MAG: PaaX family transcriptional regulator C-terminal domain-containing protein, partial [Albidovulum sp.]|uniref:PaaX family transcriptional regulator C-terminal domain-containing protein n=1 Tax=Albidovulum sp. TaxID=1872424 RepID=UPI003CC3A407